MRDVHNLLEQSQPHLSFTHDEEIKGKEILKKFGVSVPKGTAILDLKELKNKTKNFSNKNLILYSLSTGLLIQSRIMGLIFPILTFAIILLEVNNNKILNSSANKKG